jgi:hypothetical protein
MKYLLWIAMLVVSLSMFCASSQAQAPTDNTAPSPLFRGPFTLRLHIDKEHYYEEHFDKIPYVEKNDVYLFAGESFGINLATSGDEVSRVTYQPDTSKADVELIFQQDKMKDDKAMMRLIIHNKLKRTLFLDALMTVPGSKEIHKTTIPPVPAGLSDYESWPHPIVQLVLRNFRFSKNAPTN